MKINSIKVCDLHFIRFASIQILYIMHYVHVHVRRGRFAVSI